MVSQLERSHWSKGQAKRQQNQPGSSCNYRWSRDEFLNQEETSEDPRGGRKPKGKCVTEIAEEEICRKD